VNVDAMSPQGRVTSLLVTGTSPSEGKSTTAANLAAAMAGKRRNVAVFEADLRRPGLSRRFGLNGEPGVANVLRGDAALKDIIGRATVTPGHSRKGPELCLSGQFSFVPAGPVKGDPRGLLDESALLEMVDGIRQDTDTVIIDGPPISMFSDVVPIAQRVDGVVLAVRLHHTQRAALERLLDRLSTASIKPMGIVVLGAENDGGEYGHYARG
jgi:capsular exopolysaccharide synthesis family protein